jgi:Gpi18-like mannosyltransferase
VSPAADLRVIGLILGWKAFTFAVAFIAWAVLPFNHALRNANLRWGELNDGSLAAALSTWDSQHYIRLAEVGYQPGLLTNAFGPLYPWTIRALNVLTGDSIVSGLLISNVASALALYLLYRFVRQRFSEAIAWRALVLFLAFPTAFYLNLIYTEALFLLLTVMFFIALYERRMLLLAACGFLLPLLRLPGLVVVIPLIWAVLISYNGARKRSGSPSPKSERGLGGEVSPLLLLAPIAGLLGYLGYMELELGNAFVAMDTEKLYISHRSLDNLLRPWRLIEDLVRADLVWHNYLDSVMDRAFFIVLVASLPLVWRKTGAPMALFATILVLQPFLGSFMSYTRLAMVAFPIYIAWASMLEGRDRRLVYAAALPMLVLQTVLISMHVTGDWVA